MKKIERVKSQQDFQKIISSNQRINTDVYVIYFQKNDVDFPRYGIAASKKLGNAVIRVKIRRQVRAMIHQIKKNRLINKKDYIVIVKKTYLKNDYQTNLQVLDKMLKKAEENE